MAEIAFEDFALALENTRGVPEASPTVNIPYAGLITPQQEVFRPDEARGHLAALTREVTVREWSEWSGEGGLDTGFLPILANMGIEVVTSPTTPAGATASRLWEFVREMTGNTLKTATIWASDPNTLPLRATYGILKEMVITANAKNTDATTLSFEGVATSPIEVAAPTVPAASTDGLIIPLNFQVWLDTTQPIGTTEITGRPVFAEHTIPTGMTEKFIPSGPTGSKTINRAGKVKATPVTVIELELLDNTQWDIFKNGQDVKLRVRHNGDFIESGTPDFYEYVEVDAYGIMTFDSWDSFQESNRTIRLEVQHRYDATLGSDLRLAVQNTRTSLT